MCWQGWGAGRRHSPTPHEVHAVSEAANRVDPGMHAVHWLAPSSFLVSRPVGHLVHVLAAYMEGRKVRAPHGLQAVAPNAVAPLPPLPVMVPAGHTLHVFWPARGSRAGRVVGR